MRAGVNVLFARLIIPFKICLDRLFLIPGTVRGCVAMDDLYETGSVRLLTLAAHHELDCFAGADADLIAVAHYCFHKPTSYRRTIIPASGWTCQSSNSSPVCCFQRCLKTYHSASSIAWNT